MKTKVGESLNSRIKLDWKRSSGWLESWEGLLLATDVSTTCVEAVFSVKRRLWRWPPHRLLKCQLLTTIIFFSGLQSPKWSFSIKVCCSSDQTIFLVELTLRQRNSCSANQHLLTFDTDPYWLKCKAQWKSFHWIYRKLWKHMRPPLAYHCESHRFSFSYFSYYVIFFIMQVLCCKHYELLLLVHLP